ncbi:MAG: hypothetical protein IJ437_07085 [Clostridia bacterium]|nr:hypothetical protein [Clostridia bacterium]
MLTQRFGTEPQKNPNYIKEFIKAVKRQKGSCDEVWFATYYGYPSLEKHRELALLLKENSKLIKDAGIRVSLQLSNSIGHGQYISRSDCSGLVFEGSPVKNIVGENGVTAKYCFCWNGEFFRNYIKEELRIYLNEIKPHTLWIDDDLRISHHDPAVFCCFCPDCIDKFNKKHGYDFDRQELVRKINDDKTVRVQHIACLRESLSDFVYEICKVVHESSPQTRIGLQSYIKKGGYNGYGYSYIYDAMYNATGISPASRPGGGMYDDYSPLDFIIKGEDLMYQTHMLPDYVKEIRPEIENLPHVVYGKSHGGTALETSYYFACGATDMSYSAMMNENEPMSYHEQLLKTFCSHRKYWKKLSDYNKKSRQGGITFAISKNAYLIDNKDDFDYTQEYFDGALNYRFFNIPITFDESNDSIYILSAENARAMSDEEIINLLKHPVFADGEVAHILTQRGYNVGADSKRIDSSSKSEQINDNLINGSSKGRINLGQFRRTYGFEIIPTSNTAIPLGNYIHKSPDGFVTEDSISSAIVTTEYGAKWAFYGFDTWTRTVPTFIRDRILSIIEYIGNKRQCVEMKTPYQAILLPRVNEKGEVVCVSVTNVTVANTGEIEIIIRNPASSKAIIMSQYDKKTKLNVKTNEKGEAMVKIADIHPWSVATIFFE